MAPSDDPVSSNAPPSTPQITSVRYDAGLLTVTWTADPHPSTTFTVTVYQGGTPPAVTIAQVDVGASQCVRVEPAGSRRDRRCEEDARERGGEWARLRPGRAGAVGRRAGRPERRHQAGGSGGAPSPAAARVAGAWLRHGCGRAVRHVRRVAVVDDVRATIRAYPPLPILVDHRAVVPSQAETLDEAVEAVARPARGARVVGDGVAGPAGRAGHRPRQFLRADRGGGHRVVGALATRDHPAPRAAAPGRAGRRQRGGARCLRLRRRAPDRSVRSRRTAAPIRATDRTASRSTRRWRRSAS